MQNIKFLKQSKSLNAIVCGFVLIVFVGILGMSLMRYSNDQASAIIQQNMGKYFATISIQDFDKAKTFYTTKDAENVNDMMAIVEEKTKQLKVQYIKPDMIYPALINGNLGVVCVKTTTKGKVYKQEFETTEVNMFVMIKEKNDWKIARPVDLTGYNTDHIMNMLESYKSYLESYPDLQEIPELNKQQFLEFRKSLEE